MWTDLERSLKTSMKSHSKITLLCKTNKKVCLICMCIFLERELEGHILNWYADREFRIRENERFFTLHSVLNLLLRQCILHNNVFNEISNQHSLKIMNYGKWMLPLSLK